MKKSYVIAISGISGSGKTFVSENLQKSLINAKIIKFDNYPVDFLKQDYCEWSEKGADYNAWHLEPIISDLEKLIHEQWDYIILDYPFGYGNTAVGNYIDYVVFIDVPLDIALARRVIRNYTRRDPSRRPIENKIEDLDNTLTFYLERHRKTYLRHIETVKPYADLMIDGELNVEQIIEEILENINKGI